MRRYPLTQTVGFIVLAIALMTLTGMWQRTWKHVAERERERILKVEFSTMVDGAVDFKKMVLHAASQSVRRSTSARTTTAYQAVGSRGDTIGYVIPFRGRGYQGDIEGMIVVNASAQKILRLALTGSRESPETDLFERSQDFIHQFEGVDCRSPVRLMLPTDKGIHAITGASISSQIVVRLLNEHIQALKNHLEQTKNRAEGTG
jgi:Na+-translocating ferredoxin:NAD+ oxidoreductase RnfG subunit